MKLVILDRDGVINKESAAYIKNLNEWIPIVGSLAAIGDLTRAGYTIAIATNQSGVGRGYFTIEDLNQTHTHMLNEIKKHGGDIYKIYFCPHVPTAMCKCRKPETGMLEQLQADLGLNIRDIEAYFIGDSLRDLQLGLTMGCKVFLVTSEDSHGGDTLKNLPLEIATQTTIVENLAEATRRILHA